MKIRFITTWWPELGERVQRDAELSRIIRFKDISYVFDAHSDVFDRFLSITKGTRGCTLNPIIDFEAKEVKQAKYFQLQARGNLVYETTSDEATNRREIESTPLINTDAQTEICLVKKIFLSKPNVKANMISAMHWFGMYVLHHTVIEAFQSVGLTGFSINPVINTKNYEHYVNCGFLFSCSIMPKAEVDISMFKRGTCFSRIGCLTYDTNYICNTLDFNRTSENFNSFNFPDWVVSSATKKCYDDFKLKGWHFQPVLEKSSILYQEYISKCESVFLNLKQYENVKLLGCK